MPTDPIIDHTTDPGPVPVVEPQPPTPADEREQRYLAACEAVEQALAASRAIESTELSSEDDAREIVAVLGTITAARKAAEDARKVITKPLVDEKRTIDNRFKELAGPLDGVEQALKAAVADYRRKVERERRAQIAREERNRRERQARENVKAEAEQREPVRHEAPRIEPEPEATVRSGGVAATVRKVWTFEVVDPGCVPIDYCKPDEAVIRRAVRDGAREIPGVRIYEDDQVAVQS